MEAIWNSSEENKNRKSFIICYRKMDIRAVSFMEEDVWERQNLYVNVYLTALFLISSINVKNLQNMIILKCLLLLLG